MRREGNSSCLVGMSVRTRYSGTKDAIVLSIRFVAILKWRFSLNGLIRKLKRFYLPRQDRASLVDAYSACNVLYTLSYMFAYA